MAFFLLGLKNIFDDDVIIPNSDIINFFRQMIKGLPLK